MKNVKLLVSCQILTDFEIGLRNPAKDVLYVKRQNCIGSGVTGNTAGLVLFPTRWSSPGRPCEIYSWHAGQ